MMGSFGGLGGRLNLVDLVVSFLKIKYFREINAATTMAKSKYGSFSCFFGAVVHFAVHNDYLLNLLVQIK